MELFALWCGFIGAWLLVAGPIYQAAIELREEQISDERIQAATASVIAPPEISPWWWLVPPLKLYLERRRSKQYRRAFIAVLTDDEIELMVSLINKATGWLFVATGGLLIATKETYELVEGLHLDMIVFWLTVVVLAIGCVLNTAYRIARSKRYVTKKR